MCLKCSLNTFRKSQKVLTLTFDSFEVKPRELTFGGHICPPMLKKVNKPFIKYNIPPFLLTLFSMGGGGIYAPQKSIRAV